MINFKNKKILITGATGGIGNELIKKFVSLEGTVLATGTKIEKLEQLKENIGSINVELNKDTLDKINLIHNNNPNPAP